MHLKLKILLKQWSKRIVLILLFIAIVSVRFLYQIRQTTIIKYKFKLNDITCYKMPEMVLRMADDNFKPTNKNIYFVESSCKGGLNSRQACSVETAAKAHPNRSVIVLVTGPLSREFMKGSLFFRLVTELNIEFVRINMTDYLRDTPVEEVFKKEVSEESLWPVVHTSDLLRILTIYKYGGIYLDLDVLVVKSFDTLPANFIVDSNSFIIAASDDGIGKNFSTTAIREFADTYIPNIWGHNGPDLMTRTLNHICLEGETKNNETCHGFHVLNTSSFYAVPYKSWKMYMEDWRPTLNKNFYTHHLWNAMGYKTHVPKYSYYAKLAKQYCPIVYDIYKDDFGE